jgi:uncharacterized protein involved in exopolysaccharide biosynthesis
LVLAANVLCQNKAAQPNPQIASSPAYAEVLLHKTQLEAELESLLTEYTEEYPKIKDLRAELEVLKPEIDRILAVKPADAGKLTQALGRLILGKVAHAATLKKLQSQFQDVHPNVKKEKRMVEIFEAAIKEILG